MKKHIKRRIIIGTLSIIFIAVIASAIAPTAVEMTKLEPQTAELKFTETGIVTSQNSIDVYALTPGELKEVRVREGDKIKKGQIIAIVDSTDLQNQIKQLQAQSGTVSNDAQIKAQEIVVSQRQRELATAMDNEDRMRELYEKGVITEVEWNATVAARQTAESALEGAVVQLDMIKSQVSGNESAIDTLKKRVEDCTIKSPINGVVSVLNVKNTNVVSGGVPVATITGEAGPSEVEVYVSTKDVDSVYVGETVRMKLEGRTEDRYIDGEVEKIAPRAESMLSALGATEHKVKITIAFASTSLREGYAVDVDFVYYKEENQLVVPKTAVFKDADSQDKVWIIDKGKLAKTVVTKGIELRNGIVISSGLKIGDQIVNDCNIEGLKEKRRVKSK